jgi:cystathionine beta-lyase
MDERTRLIRAGAKAPDRLSRTVGPAIQKGSTVLMPDAASLYDHDQVTYGRQGLSAHDALREALKELEGALDVQLFPSGLAAITGALMAVLKTGDHVLVTDAAYKPTRRFCDHVLKGRLGMEVTYFAPDATPDQLMALANERTALIALESPASLTFEMQDVPAIAASARARGILTLMDNTWGAGHLFKPLAHGVDLSVQALTKYVGGHSDLFMGSVAVADRRLAATLDQAIIDFGWAVSPEDAYGMLRGLRTLAVRLERQGASSLKVAAWLAGQPAVLRVLHPALPGAPGHNLYQRDYSGPAGLFGFVLRPEGDVAAFLNALQLFGLGFSWGGFESLALDADDQFKVRKVKPSLGGPTIRLNIGLEDPDDLIADLDQALVAYTSPPLALATE